MHLFLILKFNNIQVLEDLNRFNILEPCNPGPEDNIRISTALVPESLRKSGKTERALPVRDSRLGRAWPLRSRGRNRIVHTWPQLLQSGLIKCIVSSQVNF